MLTATALRGVALVSARASGDRRRVVRPRRFDPSCAALADIDHRLLGVMCTHRVVRQDQLARLFPDVPERTLRYRTRRLHDLGLAGRSRPYRESGSAPNHHWPTRRADCLVRGEPLPRGGERHAPNPVFLAHTAALTELYVTLATRAPSVGLELSIYRREGEARETFKDGAQERTLAPDAMVVLVDGEGRKLGAFVEIDLGTMSHARLRFKAGLYAAYAKSDAWRERHLFLPALLFLTTTQPRATRFLAALERALREPTRRYESRPRAPLVAAAGALARTPGRLLDEACLADLDGQEGLRLLDVLRQARAPYEQALARRREREEAEEQQQRRLREDPGAMREHLRHHEHSLASFFQALGPVGVQAVELLRASTDPPSLDEREVLRVIARDLGEALLDPGMSALPPLGAGVDGEVALLIDSYRSAQQKRLHALADQYGEGLRLREAHERLRSGELIDHPALSRLRLDAERDAAGRQEQHERRLAYLEWREDAARRLARQAGPLGRLTHRREDFYPQIDRQALGVCRRCREIVYPVDRASGHGDRKPACHYCHDTYQIEAYREDAPARTEREVRL
jgi:Replication-relaxation